jgi:hypothetical protein
VRGVEELEGILYRVEGGEERTAWRWGASTPAEAAMNEGEVGGATVAGRGGEEAAARSAKWGAAAVGGRRRA